MSQCIYNTGRAPETEQRLEAVGADSSFAEIRSCKRELIKELCMSEQGTPLRPEDVLLRWPVDPKQDSDVASVLYEDFCMRARRGETPSIADYELRFPEHKDSIASLVRHQDFLRSLRGVSDFSTPCLALPSVGDELFGFRLSHELGSGAFARVFRAEQANLAGRSVVLKVSNMEGDEPQTLAQLQHTHIVPIYSVHEDANAGLRAVCMPYFGGASLSRVLLTVWRQARIPQQGQQLTRALAEVASPWCQSNPDGTSTKESGPLAELATLDYVRASVWIVARLAEALQHAHQRGVFHRDIKPSNILLGSDGQPMLLDFNLAHNLNKTQAQAAATLGGTVAYMAPEHLRALSGRDPNLVRQVDQRSDIYSLGMVLYEMLTGRNPFDQTGSYSPIPVLMEAMAVERGRRVPSMRQQRTDVPWSLESIARKCLAPDQAQRYQLAEHLAEDLRRFLADQPLKYAPELSQLERMQKWVRRHPRLTSTGTVATTAVLLLVGVGVALAGVREHLAWTQEQLTVSQTQERRRAYEEGTVHALCWVNTTSQMRDHLALGLQACENTLALYDVLERADWQNDVYWRRLEPEERLQLSEDTRELLLLLAWARVQKSPQDEDVLRDALKLLDRAEAIEGVRPSAALWWDRASYLRQLGEEEAAKAAADRALGTQPTNARDHYLLATTYLRNGGSDSHAKAVRELKESIRLNDKHYWSHMQKGICHLEMREFTLAASEFSQCVGLWPEFAWGHFNRGYALYQSGSKEEALLSYHEAIRRDPQFVNAYVNRGLVCLELKKYPQALADFQKAAQLGRDDASIHAGLGMAFEGVRRFSEADAAFEQAFRRTKTAPPSDRNRIRWTYAFAVASRLPHRAKEAFEEVLAQDPSQSHALYGLALVLVEQKEPEKALHLLDEAVKNAPHFIEARRGRAILRARLGYLEGAREDINWCLERDEKGGETLYKAACVLALATDKTVRERRALAEQAITFLQRAFVSGYGKEIAASDADLASIHGVPEFRRLLDEADKQGTNDQ